MKHIVFVFLFVIGLSSVSAQNVEVSGGVNRNSFYDFYKEDSRFEAAYDAGIGFSIGAGITDFLPQAIPMRITLRMDAYKGTFNTSYIASSGATNTHAKVDKYTLGIGVYPIHLVLMRKALEVSVGGELSFLLSDKVSGDKTTIILNKPDQVVALNQNNLKVNNAGYFGLSSRVSYNYEITKDLFLVPQVKLYIGITEEFKDIEAGSKSFRSNVELGVMYKL